MSASLLVEHCSCLESGLHCGNEHCVCLQIQDYPCQALAMAWGPGLKGPGHIMPQEAGKKCLPPWERDSP